MQQISATRNIFRNCNHLESLYSIRFFIRHGICLQ